MRTQTKLAAALSTAARLAIGTALTSLTAQDLAEEDGAQFYYNKEADKVVDFWKKSGDN